MLTLQASLLSRSARAGIIVAISVLCFSIIEKVSAKTGQEIGQLAQSVTVQINRTLGQGGSGVLISKEGNTYTVLTANHVITPQRPDITYTVRLPSGQSYPITEVQEFQSNPNDPDLALVTFESSQTYPTVTLGDSEFIPIGAEIYVAGFPARQGVSSENRDLEFTSGIVTSRPAQRPGAYTLRYNAVTRSGMSGGPVLDTEGLLVGIHGQGDVEGSIRNETGSSIAIKTGFNAGIPINSFVAINQTGVSSVSVAQETPSAPPEVVQLEDPQTARDHYVLGLTQQDQGINVQAIASFSLALEMDPNAQAYYQRGVSHSLRSEYAEAEADFTQALALDSTLSDAYSQRAIVRASMDDDQGALADFSEAIRLNPDDVVSYHNRAIIRRRQEDFQGSFEDLDQVVTLDPSAASYYNRAILRRAIDDREGSVSDFSQAIALNPEFTEAYINRSLVKRRGLGDLEGAIEDLTVALSIEPDNAVAHYNRGLFRRDLGDYEGGLQDLQSSVTLFQQNGDTFNADKAIEVIERLQQQLDSDGP